jgi:hypothetical protein
MFLPNCRIVILSDKLAKDNGIVPNQAIVYEKRNKNTLRREKEGEGKPREGEGGRREGKRSGEGKWRGSEKGRRKITC